MGNINEHLILCFHVGCCHRCWCGITDGHSHIFTCIVNWRLFHLKWVIWFVTGDCSLTHCEGVNVNPPVTGNPSKFNRCMLTQSKRYFDDKPQSTWYQSISLSHFIAKLRDGMSLQHISLSFSDNYLITNWLPWCPHNPQIRYKWNGFSSRRFGWWQWRLNTLSPHFHLIISTIIHSNTIHTSWLTKWISFI